MSRLWLGAILIAGVAGVIILLRRDRKAVRSTKKPRLAPESLSDWTKGQVRDLLQSDRKIEAIKLIRNETGMGLNEAQILVEQLIQNHQSLGQARENSSSNWAEELNHLIDQKQLISAVKLVRQTLNLSLKDAKDYVEQIQQQRKSSS